MVLDKYTFFPSWHEMLDIVEDVEELVDRIVHRGDACWQRRAAEGAAPRRTKHRSDESSGRPLDGPPHERGPIWVRVIVGAVGAGVARDL